MRSDLVYIVDDTESILTVKLKMLRTANIAAEGFSSAYEAILELGKYTPTPTTIITDLDMPKISGAEMLVFLSSKAEQEWQDHTYLRKTISRSAEYNSEAYALLRQKRTFKGTSILTSRQELKPLTLDTMLSQDFQAATHIYNHALSICDRTFKIDENGTGMRTLIDYLRQ